jgi:hypothetical protein
MSREEEYRRLAQDCRRIAQTIQNARCGRPWREWQRRGTDWPTSSGRYRPHAALHDTSQPQASTWSAEPARAAKCRVGTHCGAAHSRGWGCSERRRAHHAVAGGCGTVEDVKRRIEASHSTRMVKPELYPEQHEGTLWPPRYSQLDFGLRPIAAGGRLGVPAAVLVLVFDNLRVARLRKRARPECGANRLRHDTLRMRGIAAHKRKSPDRGRGFQEFLPSREGL